MYFAFITEIKNIRPHNNAHSLQIANVFGTDVVVGKDYKIGDVVCYFPCDGQLSLDFCKINKLLREDGGYFCENRRVRTQKFRGEISDGFVCKLDLLDNFVPGCTKKISVGDRLNEIDGKLLCYKYVTEATARRQKHEGSQKKRNRNRGSTITFPKHDDTEQLAYNLKSLQVGSQLIVTAKNHGTSGRTAYVLDEVELPLWKRILNKLGAGIPTKEYRIISGSRNVILNNADDGLPNKKMRDQVTDYFKDKLNRGEIVFYELVGWDGNASIMPAHETKKLNDKEFTEKYGEKMFYDYGCKQGVFDIYVYRIAQINEDGNLVDYTWDRVVRRAEELCLKVPHLYDIIQYDGNETALLEKIDFYADRQDPIGNHWQEGVCVRVNSSKWKCFKYKNRVFKILESIIKNDENSIDIEEAS